MLSLALQMWGEAIQYYSGGFGLWLIVLGSFLLIWRLWTFSILPLFRPHEPKEVPYWIPGKWLQG
jgi:hypothetical protein